MNAKQVLRMQMDLGLMVLKTYVSDLNDADLLRRPAKGCNPLAWQIGHLISSEAQLIKGVSPDSAVELPAGFLEAHAREVAGEEDPTRFQTKQQYVELYERQRVATVAAMEKLTEADLDRPAPEHLRKRFPTVGAVLGLIAVHPLMHAGQFVAVRRELGKPVLI